MRHVFLPVVTLLVGWFGSSVLSLDSRSSAQEVGGAGAKWSDDLARAVSLEFAEGGEPFEGFRFRRDEQLQLNFVWLLCYITKAADGRTSRIRFDDLVIARDYIGPLQDEVRDERH